MPLYPHQNKIAGLQATDQKNVPPRYFDFAADGSQVENGWLIGKKPANIQPLQMVTFY